MKQVHNWPCDFVSYTVQISNGVQQLKSDYTVAVEKALRSTMTV